MLTVARHPKAAALNDPETLQEAARQLSRNSGESNEAVMFRYDVTEILQLLDERDDFDLDALVKIEWTYLPLLEQSWSNSSPISELGKNCCYHFSRRQRSRGGYPPTRLQCTFLYQEPSLRWSVCI